MNLFKKHKRFERKIQQQLTEIEVKPSDSVWQRIDESINDGFEMDVQNRLYTFEQTPRAEIWNHIENELPSPKPKYSFLKFYGGASSLLLLLLTGVWVGVQWNQSNTLRTELTPAIAEVQPAQLPTKIEQAQKDVRSAPVLKDETLRNTTQTQSLAIDNSVLTQNRLPITEAEKTQPKTSVQSSSQAGGISSDVLNQYKEAILQTPNQVKEVINNISLPEQAKTETQHDALKTNIKNVPLNNSGSSALTQDTTTPVQQNANLAVASHVNPREVPELQSSVTVITSPTAAPALAKHKNEDELSRFSLSIYGGAMLSYTTYAAPHTGATSLNFDENIAFRKQVEKAAIDWSGGFLLDYHINDRWMISTGIMMVNFYQQFNYNTSIAATPANPNEIGAAVYNPNDTFSVGKTLSSRIKYSWNEIPLFINYRMIRNKRFAFDMQAGVSYGFISTIDGNMVSYNNKGVLVLSDKQSFPNIQNMFFATVMPQVSYAFGQNVSIGCVPTFKYGLNSMIGNERWIQQHPYFIGLNFCLRKRF